MTEHYSAFSSFLTLKFSQENGIKSEKCRASTHYFLFDYAVCYIKREK